MKASDILNVRAVRLDETGVVKLPNGREFTFIYMNGTQIASLPILAGTTTNWMLNRIKQILVNRIIDEETGLTWPEHVIEHYINTNNNEAWDVSQQIVTQSEEHLEQILKTAADAKNSSIPTVPLTR